ncbi:glycosyltransferase family 2 protein [uncultured Cohaesibacter sp.]|uniref:glycosyltransferase family 2 protein n=1 Tax=uncultured Cohaesibacter sp. TaxID=1002546 RepID=UPI00292E70D7|nr:glycosyltransferase family 2 protein [uncultured Cohaesibacter sp.]
MTFTDQNKTSVSANIQNILNRDRSGRICISLVVPVYNEEAGIEPFLDAVLPILIATGQAYEIVFVNDGSRDQTASALHSAVLSHDHVRMVDLSRNFGKEAALSAGLDFSEGDVVIPMDVDLQDPPELVPQFLEKWREGYDVVNGVRVDRSTDTTMKRNSAGLFYWLFNKLSPTDLPSNVGDYRLLDRGVVEAIKQMPERNRFLKGIFAWVGFRTTEIPFTRPERHVGTSSWNYWKLWNFALDGVIGYSTVPLRVWTYAGFALALLSFLYGVLTVLKTLVMGVDVPGYASLITVILFLSGIQIISLGIIGEYISRIFIEVKQRPLYLVREVFAKNDLRAPEIDSEDAGDEG